MSTKHMLFQIKNQILGTIFPQGAARKAARLFLTPKRFPVKGWEKEAEAGCERIPNNLFDVLTAFAGFIGLPGKATRLFVKAVEHEVGRPANALDVGNVFAALNPEALIIHAKNDREVPFACHEAIIEACPGLQAYRAESLGHRRIVRSPEVSALIGRFMRRGQPQGQPVSAPTHMERTPAWTI